MGAAQEDGGRVAEVGHDMAGAAAADQGDDRGGAAVEAIGAGAVQEAARWKGRGRRVGAGAN